MATARAAKLYTPDLLALATGLAQFPPDPALPFQAEARSRTCGSAIALGLALNTHAHITQIGMQVTACAIGQASAMLLARHAVGASADQVSGTADALEHWLAGEGALPAWPGLDALIPARDHPGRHGALMLPWKAARMALSSAATRG